MPDRLSLPDRRTQLVEAALEVAERDGLAAATVRGVARAGEVSTGVVHYAFADKHDLLAAMAEQIVKQLRGVATVPVGGGSLEAVLLGGVRNLWRSLEREAAQQLLTYEITITALRDPALRSAATRQYEVTRAAVRDFLQAAAGASGASWRVPVEQVTRLVLGQLDGVVLQFLVDGDARAARRSLETFARLLATLGEGGA